MPTLSPGAAAELQALRERAYGPHPDATMDQAARARLDELEQALTGPLSTASDPAESGTPSPGAAAPRRRPWAVVAAVAAALAVGAGAAIGISAIGASGPDATLRAVALNPGSDPALDGPLLASYRIGRGDLQAFEQYRGFRAWAGTAADGLTCLFVTDPDRGLVAQSCTAPSIHPIADFQTGNGTVSLGGGPRGILRFELHDDVVEVYDRHVTGVLEP